MQFLMADNVSLVSPSFTESLWPESELLKTFLETGQDIVTLQVNLQPTSLRVSDVDEWLEHGQSLFHPGKLDIASAVRWYVAGDHLQHRSIQVWSARVLAQHIDRMNHSPLAESSRQLVEWFFEPEESTTFSSVVRRTVAPTPGCRTPMMRSVLSVLRPEIAMTLAEETWEFRPCLASMFPTFARMWSEATSLVDDKGLQPFALAYFAHLLPSKSQWSVALANLVAPLSRFRRVMSVPDTDPDPDILYREVMSPANGAMFTDTETSGLLGLLLVYLGVPAPDLSRIPMGNTPGVSRRSVFASAKRPQFWDALLRARFVTPQDAVELAFEHASSEMFDIALEHGLRDDSPDFVVRACSSSSSCDTSISHEISFDFMLHAYHRLTLLGYPVDRVNIQFSRYGQSPNLVWDILRLTGFRPQSLLEWRDVAECIPEGTLETFVKSILVYDNPHCVGILGCVLARRPDVICRLFGQSPWLSTIDDSSSSSSSSSSLPEQALLALARKFPGIWDSHGAQGILLTLMNNAGETGLVRGLETVLAVLRHTGDQSFFAVVDCESDFLGLTLEFDGDVDTRRWDLACQIFAVGFDPERMRYQYPGLHWASLLRIYRNFRSNSSSSSRCWSWLLPHVAVVVGRVLNYLDLVTFADWRDADSLLREWGVDSSVHQAFLACRVKNMCSGKWTRVGTISPDMIVEVEREMAFLLRNELVTDHEIAECFIALNELGDFVDEMYDVVRKAYATMKTIKFRNAVMDHIPSDIRRYVAPRKRTRPATSETSAQESDAVRFCAE